MVDIVLDASVAIRTVLADELGHEDARETYALALARGAATFAPDIYRYEVGHVLARANKTDRARAFAYAQALVEIRPPSVRAMARAFDLAGEGKLSFYDAAYVTLADELGAILWTEDKQILKRAGERAQSTVELRRWLEASPERG